MNKLEKQEEKESAGSASAIWEYSLRNDGLNQSSRPFISGAPEHLHVEINKTESNDQINFAITVKGSPKEGDSFSFTPDVPGGEKSVTDWNFEGGKWVSHTWKEKEEEEQKFEE